MRSLSKYVAAFAIISCLAFADSFAFADTKADVESVVKEAGVSDISRLWDYGYKLEVMASDKINVGNVKSALLDILLTESNDKALLLSSKILCDLGEFRMSFDKLRSLVLRSKDEDIRIQAAVVAGRYANDISTLTMVYNLALQDISPLVNIANTRALWQGYRRTMATYQVVDDLLIKRQNLLRVYLTSNTPKVRNESAFLLAEMGQLAVAEPVLRQISSAPTTDGMRARYILRGYPLLDELIERVKSFYVDEDKTQIQRLMEGAAKGIVEELDPFSSYMDTKSTKQFRDRISQEFAGIGAYVTVQEKVLTISSPIYGGPAYEAGLRSLDKVTEVAGERTYGKALDELIPKLKGVPGTPVTIKIYRSGWVKEREFVIIRRNVKVPSVISNMMPGKIGYIRLVQFGRNAADEVEKALTKLEADGLKALVFDLRDNGGGLMHAAIDIVSKFIENGKVVLSERGRPSVIPERIFRSNSSKIRLQLPVVVLVNGGSASASEITAGALHDYKRATLVGTKTFGKGSVQNLMPMRSTNGQTQLRLTIAKYYLPSGICIHRTKDKDGKEVGGIEPDVKVEYEEMEPWKGYEFIEMRNSEKIQKYVDSFYDKNKELGRRLAHFDNYDYKQYPGFEEWAKTVGVKTLDHNDLRRLVRELLRKKVADEDKTPPGGDFEEDNQLQQSILVVLQKLGVKPKDIVEYKDFKVKVAEKASESVK